MSNDVLTSKRNLRIKMSALVSESDELTRMQTRLVTELSTTKTTIAEPCYINDFKKATHHIFSSPIDYDQDCIQVRKRSDLRIFLKVFAISDF